jgi:hypothetical protein
MEQQDLIFPDIPCPHKNLWTQLDNKPREAAIEVLARLIAQTLHPEINEEENNDA